MLSLTAGEYMKMAVTLSTHIFRLYSLLFVCVCLLVRVLERRFLYALTAVLKLWMVLV